MNALITDYSAKDAIALVFDPSFTEVHKTAGLDRLDIARMAAFIALTVETRFNSACSRLVVVPERIWNDAVDTMVGIILAATEGIEY